jgi:hypothetical protein
VVSLPAGVLDKCDLDEFKHVLSISDDNAIDIIWCDYTHSPQQINPNQINPTIPTLCVMFLQLCKPVLARYKNRKAAVKL